MLINRIFFSGKLEKVFLKKKFIDSLQLVMVPFFEKRGSDERDI